MYDVFLPMGNYRFASGGAKLFISLGVITAATVLRTVSESRSSCCSTPQLSVLMAPGIVLLYFSESAGF